MPEDKKPAEGTSLETKPLEQSSTPANGEDPASMSGPTLGSQNEKSDLTPKKKGIKSLFRKIDVYLLGFILLVVIGAIVVTVNYLNSKKNPPAPNAASQNLTPNELKQLANSNATVGDTGQTVTIQGNAIFSGQVLVRSDLDVAGNIKLGGQLQAQNFTASGTVNLTNTQIQTLQVAQDSTMQGSLTVQKNLNVAGTTSFSGAVTAGALSVSNLTLSGNGVLQIPDHITVNGPSPTRAGLGSAVGAGGSASVNGSDTSGTVNVNTGANTSPGCFISINFHQAYTSTPHVIISPVGEGAGETEYYVTRTTTGMSVCTSNSAPAHQNFAFDYFITG